MWNIQTKRALQIIVAAFLVLVSYNCSDDQNNFVPYAKVNKYISLANYNTLYIPGNSVTFSSEGYAGLIVICINESQYYAFDACCPYEGGSTCIAKTETNKTGIYASSNPIATCNCCGSQYNLFGGGYPTKGPSGRNLKQYQVSIVGDRLWIHN